MQLNVKKHFPLGRNMRGERASLQRNGKEEKLEKKHWNVGVRDNNFKVIQVL